MLGLVGLTVRVRVGRLLAIRPTYRTRSGVRGILFRFTSGVVVTASILLTPSFRTHPTKW